MASGIPQDIQTLVKLYAPREVGVTLVPYQAVEKAEYLLFWACVFLGILTAFLGSLISLVVINYGNNAVVWLLAIVTFLLFVFFIAFAIRGFRERREVRLAAMSSGDTSGEEFKNALQIWKVLGRSAFKEEQSLPIDEFLARLAILMPGLDLSLMLLKLYGDAVVLVDNAASGRSMVKYNSSFEQEIAHKLSQQE